MATSKEYTQTVNPGKLAIEITAVYNDLASVNTYQISGIDRVNITFDSDKDAAQWLTVDSLLAAHVTVDLQDVKNTKNAAIDFRTNELFNAGFVHDSQIFSLSNNAQRNWIGISSVVNGNIFSALIGGTPTTFAAYNGTLAAVEASFFPLQVSTIDDMEYEFTTYAEFISFFNAGFAIADAHYASGRALKVQVNAAVDEAAVDAIIDNR